MGKPELDRYFLTIDSDELMPVANSDLEAVIGHIQQQGLEAVAGIASPAELPVRALVRMMDEPRHLRRPAELVVGPHIMGDPPRQLGGIMLYRVTDRPLGE